MDWKRMANFFVFYLWTPQNSSSAHHFPNPHPSHPSSPEDWFLSNWANPEDTWLSVGLNSTMSLMLGKRPWGRRCEKHAGIDLEAWTLDEASAGLTCAGWASAVQRGLQVNWGKEGHGGFSGQLLSQGSNVCSWMWAPKTQFLSIAATISPSGVKGVPEDQPCVFLWGTNPTEP